MIISLLYWRSVLANSTKGEISKTRIHTHSVEEIKAFERRLAVLRNANFRTAPPKAV